VEQSKMKIHTRIEVEIDFTTLVALLSALAAWFNR
jgi:hypothetical protein